MFLETFLLTSSCIATGLLARAGKHKNFIPFPLRPRMGYLVTNTVPSAPLAAASMGVKHTGWSTLFSFLFMLMVLFLHTLMDTLPSWDGVFGLPWIHLCRVGIKAFSRAVLQLNWTLQWKHHKHKHTQVPKHHPPACLFLGCQNQRGRWDPVWKTTPFTHPILHFWRLQWCCSTPVTDLFSWAYRKGAVFRVQGPFCFPAK